MKRSFGCFGPTRVTRLQPTDWPREAIALEETAGRRVAGKGKLFDCFDKLQEDLCRFNREAEMSGSYRGGSSLVGPRGWGSFDPAQEKRISSQRTEAELQALEENNRRLEGYLAKTPNVVKTPKSQSRTKRLWQRANAHAAAFAEAREAEISKSKSLPTNKKRRILSHNKPNGEDAD